MGINIVGYGYTVLYFFCLLYFNIILKVTCLDYLFNFITKGKSLFHGVLKVLMVSTMFFFRQHSSELASSWSQGGDSHLTSPSRFFPLTRLEGCTGWTWAPRKGPWAWTRPFYLLRRSVFSHLSFLCRRLQLPPGVFSEKCACPRCAQTQLLSPTAHPQSLVA